ncbi:hypothetical protein VIGAN_09179600, partial [Vigna angularis var. angularis]
SLQPHQTLILIPNLLPSPPVSASSSIRSMPSRKSVLRSTKRFNAFEPDANPRTLPLKTTTNLSRRSPLTMKPPWSRRRRR